MDWRLCPVSKKSWWVSWFGVEWHWVSRLLFLVAVANDVIISSRYRAGLTECAHEVCSYLKDTEGVEQETLTRLANHLNADITVCTCHTGMSQDVATGRPYTTSGAVSKPSHLVQLPGMCPSGQLTSGQASGWRQRLTPHSGVGQLGSTPLPKVSACGLLALPKGQVGLAHLLAQLGNNTSRYGDVDRDTEVDTQTPGNRSTKDGRHPETSDTSCLWVNCENKAQNNHATHTNTPSVGHTRAQNKTDVRNLTVEPIWRPWWIAENPSGDPGE